MENKKSYQNLTKDELIRELELSDKIIDGMVKRNNNHRLLTKKERNKKLLNHKNNNKYTFWPGFSPLQGSVSGKRNW
ncbi:MAG: hypothetical protein QF567_00875 [Candidatus Pacearchaeota archaeon]|nr:hypothetical protein [Candidatus Pacearchaeota archaeon]